MRVACSSLNAVRSIQADRQARQPCGFLQGGSSLPDMDLNWS